MSESLVMTVVFGFQRRKVTILKAKDILESERFYYLEEKYPAKNLVPRDVASRNAKYAYDGLGVDGKEQVLDFSDAIKRDGEDAIRARYGNLLTWSKNYRRKVLMPMRIYPVLPIGYNGWSIIFKALSKVFVLVKLTS